MYAADNKEDRILGRWIKYAQAFNVPAGMMKLIQGLWLLDHKDFEVRIGHFVETDTNLEWTLKDLIETLTIPPERIH